MFYLEREGERERQRAGEQAVRFDRLGLTEIEGRDRYRDAEIERNRNKETDLSLKIPSKAG
jgi:hypothetical protein